MAKLAVIGKSGSGKTTVLKHLHLAILRDSKQSCLFVSQPRGILDQTLADYFDLEPNAELSLAQQTALKKVGLEEIVDRFKSVDAPSLNCSELSTGQFLRLAIVRAALSKPSFLIIDEPFSPLDYRAAKRVEAYLKQIKRDGVGVVITSHQLNKLIVDECFDIGDLQNGN